MDHLDTLPAVARQALEHAGTVLVYRDDATGERMALSGQALSSWAARTANLLTADCGLAPGALAAVLMPPHWQTAAVLLGAWAAGLSVEYQGLGTSGLPHVGRYRPRLP